MTGKSTAMSGVYRENEIKYARMGGSDVCVCGAQLVVFGTLFSRLASIFCKKNLKSMRIGLARECENACDLCVLRVCTWQPVGQHGASCTEPRVETCPCGFGAGTCPCGFGAGTCPCGFGAGTHFVPGSLKRSNKASTSPLARKIEAFVRARGSGVHKCQ